MRRLILVVTLALLLLFGGSLAALAQEPVELVVYFSPECGHCQDVQAQILPKLTEQYGDRLILTMIDVTQPDGLAALEAAEQRVGKPNNPLPVIFMGDEVFASEDITELDKLLGEALRQRLGAGEITGQNAPAAPIALTTPEGAKAVSTQPIHLAYVKKEGCSACARASVVLEAVQKAHPAVIVRTFDDRADADLVEAMGQQLGLDETKHLVAPAIYVGRDALVGDEISGGSVELLLKRYEATGAPAFWEDLSSTAGQQSILARFRSMGPLAVIAAALIDGVNPCAFATILFFVSYLAISRRPRRDMLIIGLAFTAGVFMTYLLVGLGLMSLLRLANTIRVIGLVLYGAMGLGCLVLAGMSLYDYILARQGRLHDMTLNLPDKLRERIKGRIRAASGAFVGAALGSGFIVSLLELACTGQVYLPTISFVVGLPEMRTFAVGYLLLYNLVFILPLLVILLLAVYGVSAARFQEWFTRHAATAKLIMTALFLVLGGLLLSQAIAV